jgi:hypothetical protein
MSRVSFYQTWSGVEVPPQQKPCQSEINVVAMFVELACGAELGGEFVLRLAVGAASTQMRHIDGVWDLLCREADRILKLQDSLS